MGDLRPKLWFSAGEVARKLGVSRRSVTRYCESGAIAAQRTLGGQWRIARATIDALLPALSAAA